MLELATPALARYGQVQSDTVHTRALDTCYGYGRRGSRGYHIAMSSSGLKKIVNIAICGFGRAGRIHFHNIRKNHRYAIDSRSVLVAAVSLPVKIMY